MKPWEILATEKVLDTYWVTVQKDSVRLPGGAVIEDYYVIHRKNFSVIFGLTPENEVVLVRQYKHGVRKVLLELPAGFIEDGEAPEAAARREFEEETGYCPENIHFLGKLVVGPSNMNHSAYAYLATGAVNTGSQHLDATEDIEVVLVPAGEISGCVQNGGISCLSSVAVIYMALDKMKAQPPGTEKT